MSAAVIPFPLAKRLDLIHRQAEYALCLKPEKAEQHIHRQLQCQADALHRRGVSPAAIKRELAAMEMAIRTVMWRLTFGTPEQA
ncbi:DUF6074 family protein [Bradyrhizobium australafricanum]|uniref:DUF6074 family protein n=1 Tax=Bradyrhizobium australafricanum TaxID=2821406 RepID=UPI001CE38218|nr:DUF6074 family protein [Bradyrhizobium australafricanum]MCA6103942.1 hypothetical protein [Bradyrhizobium australafricanum]